MDDISQAPGVRFEPAEPPSPAAPTTVATTPAPSTSDSADQPAADVAGGSPDLAPVPQASPNPGFKSKCGDQHQHAPAVARIRRKARADTEPSNRSQVRRGRNGPRPASSHSPVFVDVVISRLVEPAKELQDFLWRAPTGSAGLDKRTRRNLEARLMARPILVVGDPNGEAELQVVGNGEDLPHLRAQLGHEAVVPVLVIRRNLTAAEREEIALHSMLAHALTAPPRKGLAPAIEGAVARLQALGSPPLIDCRKMPLARAFDLDHRSFSGKSERTQTVTVPQFPMLHRSKRKRLPN